MNSFSENALNLPELSTRYRREKALEQRASLLKGNIMPAVPGNEPGDILIYDAREVLEDKLQRSSCVLEDTKLLTPQYTQELKRRFGSQIITGFFDSPAYESILLTVPFDERPPIMIGIYADGLDRDSMLYSSGQNKIHCTSMKILNTARFGLRKPDDYELLMVLNETLLKKYGYNTCHKALISQLTSLVTSGITYHGKKHAVRLAYLQVKMN